MTPNQKGIGQLIERRLQLLEKADGPEYQITRIKRPIIAPDGQLVGTSVYKIGFGVLRGRGRPRKKMNSGRLSSTMSQLIRGIDRKIGNNNSLSINSVPLVSGGERGIRTLGTLASSTVFETVPFSHSGTSPRVTDLASLLQLRKVS